MTCVSLIKGEVMSKERQIKVSIIVPVYNAEQFLDKCIGSIMNQTLADWQLLLVDDCSTDNSGLICDKYALFDKRIKSIHNEKNKGVSATRNLGISLAEGEYIGFVDSDDTIKPNMFEVLYSEAINNNVDIVMCDVTTVYDNGKHEVDTITQLSENQILKKSDFTPSLLLEMAGSACRCIYKNYRCNDNLYEHLIEFPNDIKFSEDRIFNLYAFGYANKVCYIKESYYNRFMNVKSTVHRFHKDYFEAYKQASDEISQAIKIAWEDNRDMQKAYLSQFITGAMGAICNYYYKTSPLSSNEKKNMVKKLCDDRQLRSAIETYGVDKKTKWILERKYTLIIVYAKLANWKHGR